MLKMVDGTGIIGVDMICPLGVSTPQPPNYDKVELEGTGMLVLPNSLDAPLERLELGGKTEQVTTTGKNLANPSEFVIGALAGDTGNIIKLKQYIATGYIPVTPGKRYSTSCGNKFLAHTIFAYDKEKTKINSVINMSSEMPEGAAYIRLSYRKIDTTNVTESDMEELKKVCMVNEGSTVLPYEPYTGGKPSPSPEYQQEIKNVGKWNEETQKYEVDAKVTGKNLLNLQKASEKVNWTQHSNFPGYYNFPVFVGRGNTVTISIPQKIPTGQGLFLSVCLTESGAREGWIAHNSNDSLNNTKLTYKATNDYIYLNAHSDTIAGMKKYFGNLQVEYGNVATPYQPYKEQTLTLTSDRPITKWDRLVEQGGQIGWLYQSAINEYRGDASVAIYQNGFCFLLNNKKLKSGEGYCEELKQYVSREEKPCINFNMSPNTYAYTLNTQAIYGSTTSAIKEYLKTHPLHLVYKTETTEFVPLPQSEQNAIRALKTYYPTTVITADGGELDPDIKATYRKEI